ncbi:MAG: chromosome partitioning protein, ParB family [Phormidesmis priestleyi Ana]|uniref:Chromosome partitioning protein, ParB family n=1 Tax=Phormidesmis priestleyi Ana TaxID=1666911 RepID=A0A0P7ZPN2_9CYAN|nr:MAG: chromosome partitioning protein, ParB family [Phormidesmis priestleyi Ana]
MRNSKRKVSDMFGGAIAAKEGETIVQLKEEIESLKSSSAQSLLIPVSDIQALELPGNLKQPRLYFDPIKLERLRESIRKHGVLEPILVRPKIDGGYETVSGERRWRSCCELGLKAIPAIVREMSDEMALEAALIAHLLNEEITAIEQTESILSLLSLHLNISIEDVKAGLYKANNSQIRGTENSRIFNEEEIETISNILGEFGMKLSSFVSNRLPMLNLAPEILEAVRQGKLSPTNAVLLNRQRPELHGELVEQAKGLTKEEVIALVKEVALEQSDGKPAPQPSLSDKVFARIKAVRRKKALLASAQVQKKLGQIDQLLQEIEQMSV